MNKNWRYQDNPNADDIIIQQSKYILKSILESPTEESIEQIKDTRNIHKTMFNQLVNNDNKVFAGHYRGEDFPDLIDRIGSRQIEISPSVWIKHRFVEPKNVLVELDKLKSIIEYLCNNRNILEKQQYYSLAVEILIRFFFIHPYVNGNGHMGRIVMTYLMKIADIKIDKSWTIHPRPYTNAIAVCMFSYDNYPIIAEQFFRQWFYVPNNKTTQEIKEYESNSYSLSINGSDSDSNKRIKEDSDSEHGYSYVDDRDSGSGDSSKKDSDSDSDSVSKEKSNYRQNTIEYFYYSKIEIGKNI